MTKTAGRHLEVFLNAAPVGQLRSISPLGSSRALRDKTRHSDEFMQYELGTFTGHQVELVLASKHGHAARAALYTAFQTKAEVNLSALQEEVLQIAFPANVIAVWEEAPLDGLYAMGARVQILEQIVYTSPPKIVSRAAAISAIATITAAGRANVQTASASIDAIATITAAGRVPGAGVAYDSAALYDDSTTTYDDTA